MKKWSNLWWKIHHWMWAKSPIYVNTLNFGVLYETWRPWKKYFRKPTIKYWGHWYTNWTTLFRLELRELQWKSKYGSNRHEEDPVVLLTLFGHNFRWTASAHKTADGDDITMQYYETLMWMRDNAAGCNSPAEALYKAIENNTWDGYKGNSTYRINCINMLTPLGDHLYTVMQHVKEAEKERLSKGKHTKGVLPS